MSLIPRFLKALESHLNTFLSSDYNKIFENSSTQDKSSNQQNQNDNEETYRQGSSKTDSANLQAIYNDLAVFDLTLPVTLETLTQKRNSLLRAYHPDKFEGNSEKKQTANEMIQIINGAYERLKVYLKKTASSQTTEF